MGYLLSYFTFYTVFLAFLLQTSASEDGNVKKYNSEQDKTDVVSTRLAGLHNISGEIYYINTDAVVSWFGALETCTFLNMKMLSLESQTKNSNIMDYLATLDIGTARFWSSGVNIKDTWVWSGIGYTFTNTAWMDGEPVENNTCMAFWVGLGRDSWYDQDCSCPNCASYPVHIMCE